MIAFFFAHPVLTLCLLALLVLCVLALGIVHQMRLDACNHAFQRQE